MKYKSILTAIFLSITIGLAQNINLKEMGLKGKIQLLNEARYNIKDKFGEETLILEYKYKCQFDKNGNAKAYDYTSSYGTVTETTQKFDKNNNLIEKFYFNGNCFWYYNAENKITGEYIFSGNGGLSYSKEYDYNIDSNNLIIYKTDPFSNTSKILVIFNNNGDTISVSQYDNVKNDKKVYYEYDDRGRIIKERFYQIYPNIITQKNHNMEKEEPKYFVSLNLTNIYTYEEEKLFSQYDNKNNIIDKTTYGRNGDLREKIKYKYNEYGQLIEENRYEDNGDLYRKTIYKFNELKQLEEKMEYDGDGYLSYKTKFSYNDNGDLINKKHYYGESIDSSWDYEYDKSGNMIIENEYEYYGYNHNKRFIIKTVRKFDGSSNVIEEMYHNSDCMFKKNKYKYDEKENKTEFIQFGRDNKLNFLTKFKYDNYNNLILEFTVGSCYKIFKEHHINYKYNETGGIIGEVHINNYGDLTNWKKMEYYDDGKLKLIQNGSNDWSEKVNYIYSNDGKKIEKKYYNNYDNLSTIICTTYNDRNLIIEINETDDKQKLKKNWTYTYNENDDITNEVYHNYEYPHYDEVILTKYVYDAKGNWIEKKYSNSQHETLRINKREITYY